MIHINIEIKKLNRIKKISNTFYNRLEDLLFFIIKRTPDKMIPDFLMKWLDKYTHKRLLQLKQEVIRNHWRTVELEKSVDNIHNKQQD